MNDLIRREDVLKLFPINDCSDKMIGLYERVLDIPTAYDVDKVVAELQKSELCHKCKNNHNKISYCATFCDVGKRLDIVKAGGVE